MIVDKSEQTGEEETQHLSTAPNSNMLARHKADSSQGEGQQQVPTSRTTQVRVDVNVGGNSSDSGASLSPDSITEEYHAETLSDEEINELYLGNVSSKHRRRGVFGSPISKKADEDTSEYGGSPNTSDSLTVQTPERKVSSVSFDLDAPEDYSHLRRQRGNINGGSKRISFGGFQEDEKDKERSKHGRRWSRASFELHEPTDTATKSDSSINSCQDGVASHVRRDSIALALKGIPPVNQTPQKFSLLDKMKEMNWKDKDTYKKYVIHFFVIVVFILSLVFVIMAWYYHNESETAIASSQKIFFNPRDRVLTLSDPQGHDVIHAKLGQEIPSWQLPLNCPIVETGDQSKKECKWKKHAVLRIRHFKSVDRQIQCYNVSWQSLNHRYVPYDCFDIEDTQWYGSSNLTSGSLPISGKFEFNSNKYSSGRDSVLQSAVEYYWINSNAVAIVVNSNIPTHIKWNTTRPGQMCLVSNFTVPFYDHEEHRLPYLNYTICNGHDILQTHLYMRNYHSDPETLRLIDSNVLRYPHWSTVAEKRSRDINQEDVESVARTVIKHGLNCNTIQIDGMWQSSIGDFVFNSDTFPNITHMIETVKSANCRLSIEVNPYFHFSSANYNDGVRYGFFVKDSGDSVPGLVHWQHGIASVLDVSNSKARAWYMEKLFSLTSNFGIRSVRFSYGNTDWLPHRPHFSVVRENPNTLRHLFTNMVSKVTPELILDSTSQSQHIGGILSVKASIIINGTKACISDIVSKSLTLGILGYPFIMSDGFRSYQDENKLIPAMLPSKDLFIRWMELSAFFPAMSYSLSPWSYDLDTVRVSRNTSRLHESLVMPIISSPKMKQELLQGLSILRPLWMSDSTDVVAKSVRDQFLVGDKLLVAPVFCEGTFERDIYIPRGIWSDQLRSTLVVGPKWLSKYHTGLYEIPHFVFMRVYD